MPLSLMDDYPPRGFHHWRGLVVLPGENMRAENGAQELINDCPMTTRTIQGIHLW